MIRQLEEAMWEAAKNRDAEAFLGLVDPNAVMVCGGFRCSGREYSYCHMPVGSPLKKAPSGASNLVNTGLSYHAREGSSIIPKPTSFFCARCRIHSFVAEQ